MWFGAAVPAALAGLDAAAGSAATRGGRLNPLVMRALRKKPLTSMADVARVYGRLLAETDRAWLTVKAWAPVLPALPDPDREQLRQALYGSDSPVNVPPG